MRILLPLIVVHLSVVMQIYGELAGDHVCQVEERYKVNVTKYEPKNVTVRTYKWCLNVPPRCSEYMIKGINETKYVLEDRVRLISKCCLGYVEDESGTSCKSQCQNCTHGDCQSDNTCRCRSGFHGHDCIQVCDSDKWGANCINNCTCLRGTCNPITGECLCPWGWFGKTCESACPTSAMEMYDHKHCKKFYLTESYFSTIKSEMLEKLNTYNTKPTLRKYHTFATVPKEIATTATATIDTTEFDTSISFNVTSIATPNVILANPTTTAMPYDVNERDGVKETTGVEVEKLNYLKEPQTIDENPMESSDSGQSEEESPKIESVDEENNGKTVLNANNKNALLITVITIIAIITIIVIITLVRVLRRNGTDAESKVEKNIDKTTVSVYTKSIFHTPLPDPPVFENPTFTTPITNENKGSIETHVVCNIHFPSNRSNRNDEDELFYDHPPSTGSYRAAAVPEPPKMLDIATIEPLYDEIPCCSMSTKMLPIMPYDKNGVSSIYMNTINEIT